MVARPISDEMKQAYLDYSMSVIMSRALPDVRDGLKPVHRRILYAMHKMNLTAGAKTRKSAAVVGEVLGKYHPHGDAAVYDAMVKMAQDFTYRYPLVIGQGNFGSIDGDAAAAMRYTEAKMSEISSVLLADIGKDTVDFRENYDGTTQEPVVLPAGVPNLLLNGTLGIAVGMATNIPPHNLSEIVDATVHLIDNEDATVEDLLEYIQGPDFPTGALVFGREDIKHAYQSGRGGVLQRGEAEIIEGDRGMHQIVITSLPYRVNKAKLIVKMAKLVKDDRLSEVKDIRDESTSDIRIAVDLKQGSHPNKVLNALYKHTQLEEKFHFNVVALVDGVPQTLSLKAILEEFIAHRREVVTRRAKYELKKAEAREHILLGLTKALDHIDEIIKLIKQSEDRDDAHANLKKKFKFSDKQAAAILAMRLQRLAGLERKKIEDELAAVQATIKELKELLGSVEKIKEKIKEELLEIKEKHGDERRTRVIPHDPGDIDAEDLIPNEETILVYTDGGYIKRTNPSAYKRQKRGGVGVVDLNTKEDDYVTALVTATMHSDVLFFTDKGKVYQLKMYDLPEGRRATRGKSIVNFLELQSDERVTSILPMPKALKEDELSLVMVTKQGTSKKVDAASFHDVRRSGLIAITLEEGDELVSASFARSGDDVMVVTKDGQAIRFDESEVREMGRTAKGVRGIRLNKDDFVVAADTVAEDLKDPHLFVVTENGNGKKTALSEYSTQKRGGKGLKTAKITQKTGPIIAARVVSGEDKEIVAMSRNSQAIRIDLDEVPALGRNTQGVRIMKLREGDKASSLVSI